MRHRIFSKFFLLVSFLFIGTFGLQAKSADRLSQSQNTIFADTPQQHDLIVVAQNMSEAEAFSASKDLNTIEGWNAFLRLHPSGFRADLARAYIKKLKGSSETQAKATTGAAYRLTPNAAIHGHDSKKLFDVSVDQCKEACTNETSFLCKSFDYYKGRNICDLSDKSASDIDGLRDNYAGDPYDHYARNIRDQPVRATTQQPRYRPVQRTTRAKVAEELICENGRIRSSRCVCRGGYRRVENAPNDFTCVKKKTVAKVVCKYGYISGGKCKCGKKRTRVKKGYRKYTCVRKKTVTKRKKKKAPWTQKNCSSRIPGCLRKCKGKNDPYCEINCQQMCSLH